MHMAHNIDEARRLIWCIFDFCKFVVWSLFPFHNILKKLVCMPAACRWLACRRKKRWECRPAGRRSQNTWRRLHPKKKCKTKPTCWVQLKWAMMIVLTLSSSMSKLTPHCVVMCLDTRVFIVQEWPCVIWKLLREWRGDSDASCWSTRGWRSWFSSSISTADGHHPPRCSFWISSGPPFRYLWYTCSCKDH